MMTTITGIMEWVLENIAGLLLFEQLLRSCFTGKSRRKKKAADMRNRGSLFIDDICGFIGAHIKIDKGIINNGNESNCSYQK